MKTMGNIRKLFLLLALIVAGAESAWATLDHWGNNHADVTNVSVGGVTYEVCHTYVRQGIFTTELGMGIMKKSMMILHQKGIMPL